MTTVQYLNHASVLIQYEDAFLITDPWDRRPAFGSWLPVPPPAIHPAYILSLAERVDNFVILISHGHPDHLDANYLSLFRPDIKVAITHFDTPGLARRLQRIGLDNIIELTAEPTKVGAFVLKGYLNRPISLDDSLQTIETPDSIIVHANDNWHDLPDLLAVPIKIDIGRFNNSLYMVQLNIADGYPYAYDCYDEEEKKVLAKSRIENMAVTASQNAKTLGAKYIMQYAGHSKFFVKGREDLLALTGFPEYSQVKESFNQDGFPHLIDILPLETFDFTSVSHPWGKRHYSEKSLKENSTRYYEKNLDYLNCDTFRQDSEELDSDQRHQLMNAFMMEFKKYVLEAVARTKYRSDILASKLKLESLEDEYSVEIRFDDEGGKSSDVDLHMIFPNNLMDQILVGKINWSNSYIGCEGVFRMNPIDRYNGHAVRWMAMFGHVYQNQIAPKLVSLTKDD